MKQVKTAYLDGGHYTEGQLKSFLAEIRSQPVQYEDEHAKIVSSHTNSDAETWLHLDPEKVRAALRSHDTAGFSVPRDVPRYVTLSRSGVMGWNFAGDRKILRGVFR